MIKAETKSTGPGGYDINLQMEGPLYDLIVEAAGILRAMYDNIASDDGTRYAETFRRVLMKGLNKEAFWHDPDLCVDTTEEGVLS